MNTIPRFRRDRRWVLMLGKAAVSATLLYIVARQASWERVFDRLAQASVQNVLLAFVPLLAVTLCVGVRWRYVASAVARSIRVTEAWSVCMISAALDQVLVSMTGDAYRVWWLRSGAPSLAHAVAGVLLDRVAGVLGIALLVAFFLPRFVALERSSEFAWLPVTLAGAVVLGFVALLVMDRLPVLQPRHRWLAGIALLSSSARRVFLSAGTGIPALLAAVLVHCGICVAIVTVAWALGIALPLIAALTVVPTVMLVSVLPISIGGWGVREGAMVLGLGLVGVESSDAFAVSVTYGLLAVLIGISGALVWALGLPSPRGRPA